MQKVSLISRIKQFQVQDFHQFLGGKPGAVSNLPHKSFQDIDGVKAFDKIVTNIGAQLKLPKEDIEGIRLSAMGGSSKRDYLAFDCAMKDKGEVR